MKKKGGRKGGEKVDLGGVGGSRQEAGDEMRDRREG